MRLIFARVIVAALALAAGAARALDYPAKPVRVVVPFPAGGILDLVTRPVAERIAAAWGQPIVVEPRPGANGNIGIQFAKNASPDGYTLLSAAIFLAVNPALDPNSKFKTADFVGVAQIGVTPNVFVVPGTLQAGSLRDFVEYARARPGRLAAGHPGTGTLGHLGAVLFAEHAGVELLKVPYKGLPQAMPDLLSGQLSFMVLTSSFALPHVKAGKIRALAVDTQSRLRELPDVPTVVEAGFPSQMVAAQWFGFVAPAGTPRDVVLRFNGEVRKALAAPEVVERLGKIGLVIGASSPEQFDDLLRSESERWGRVIRERNLKAD